MELKPHIINAIRALPEVDVWPELATLFERATEAPNKDWYIPLRACQAVGGEAESAILAGVALACLQVSIILVDDILDEEPDAEYTRRGAGPTANMALALGAIPFRLLAGINSRRLARRHRRLPGPHPAGDRLRAKPRRTKPGHGRGLLARG